MRSRRQRLRTRPLGWPKNTPRKRCSQTPSRSSTLPRRPPPSTETILASLQKCFTGTTEATAAARAAESASAASFAPLATATRAARAALHGACDAASVQLFALHLREVRAATGDVVASLDGTRLNAESARSLAQSAAAALGRCEAAEDAHLAAAEASLERARGAEAARLREVAAQCAAALRELREAFPLAAARDAATKSCAGLFERASEASKAADRAQAEVFGDIFLGVFGGAGAADAPALLKNMRDAFHEQRTAAFSAA